MALYLISYDLTAENPEEYAPLWAWLEQNGAKRILYSQWVVKYGENPAKLFDEIAKLLREGDGLMVQEMTRTVNWQNLRLDVAEFRILLRDARLG